MLHHSELCWPFGVLEVMAVLVVKAVIVVERMVGWFVGVEFGVGVLVCWCVC